MDHGAVTIRPAYILYVIGAASLTIRTLFETGFGNSTLLYLVVPFAISIALCFLTTKPTKTGIWWRYLAHLRISSIVFFATSAILFEGFLCVLMFMPIYYAFVTVGFAFAAVFDKREDGDDYNNIFKAYSIPLVVLMLATEGLTPATTWERENSATFVAETSQDVATLKANMAAPIAFTGERAWFLQLFPLPDRILAGSLGVGDVHQLDFTYKKWFFANYHRGVMEVLIAEVSPMRIRTEITRNTAYLSHYMDIHGTEVNFTPLAGGRTRVELTVKYRRLLDPAWYFGPMQNMAAKQSAQYLIESIIARHPVEEISGGE